MKSSALYCLFTSNSIVTNIGYLCYMDLIQLYNSGYDKHSDKGNVHTYIQSYYSKEFILPERVRNVLEIGIMFGGSHMLWHDYFKAANIVGMDINEEAIETLYNNSEGREYDRLDLHAVDAYTQEAVDTTLLTTDPIHSRARNMR